MAGEVGQWREVRLGDLVQITHGWPFKSELFSEELTGRPIVVNIGNFKYAGGFRFESTTLKEYRGDYPAEYELSPGDILLVMTCQTAGGEILGIPGRIPNDGLTFLHNQRLGKVMVKKPGEVDHHFLYWLFLWSEFNRELFMTASGTKILHTAPTRIEAFKFRLPPLKEQQAIACILGALDDKIEVNRRMNRTLEGLARTIFQNWFVDFDPVRAKAAGQTPPGLAPHLAALFPAAFENSELGEIPKGWSLSTVGECLRLSREAVDPSEFPDEEFDHFSIPAFDAGKTPAHDLGASIKSQKFVVGDDCVLVSKLNPRTPRVWMPPPDVGRRRIASTEFFVCIGDAKEHVSREFVGCLSTNPVLIEYLTSHATGTSNSHQRVRPNDFLAFQFKRPTERVLRAFTQIVRPMFGRIETIQAESATLATLRDALLPKLISGELRVPNTERIVGRSR